MDLFEAFERLALALAIGMLVGIERGWQGRDLPAGGRVAGIRTFALTGLLGGLAGYLETVTGPILPSAVLLVFAAAFAAFSFRAAPSRQDHSVTSVVAALVVFSLGFVAATSDMRLAAAGGVAVAGLLAARHSLHGFLKALTWLELRSALVLLVMSFIVLPLLPNRAIDPWGGFNPFQVWLMTILIAAISYVGYAAVKIAGTRLGLLLGGAAGGFISSTATTLSYARLSVEQPVLSQRLAAAAMIAGMLSLARALIIASVFAPHLIAPLATALVPGMAVFAVVCFWLMLRPGESHAAGPLQLQNPFELPVVLRFGAFLGVVLFLSKVLVDYFGASSIVVVALFSGLADLDAITLSTAALSGNSVPFETAALAILTAAMANLFTKAVLAVSVGTPAYGRSLALATVAVVVAGAAGYAALGRLFL